MIKRIIINDYIPGIYGTPSPFAFSLISLNVEQAVNGDNTRKNNINIFLNIRNYIWSILAAQYLNSGIFPYGSKAGLVNKFAAASL